MNAFTGGCHYTGECELFHTSCHHCPQLREAKVYDLAYRNYELKYRAYSGLGTSSLIFIAPSMWLAKEARKSSLLNDFNIYNIRNGVDLSVFNMRDRVYSRSVLGISKETKVILFVADYISNVRKGLDLLFEAFGYMTKTHDTLLLSVGNGDLPNFSDMQSMHLGSVGNERLMSLIYAASDVLAIPSREDNLPNTAVEALACGLPIVGFDIGGMRDLVVDSKSGYLALPGNTRQFASLLRKVLEESNMSTECRKYAELRFDVRQQVREYLSIYQKLCGSLKKE